MVNLILLKKTARYSRIYSSARFLLYFNVLLLSFFSFSFAQLEQPSEEQPKKTSEQNDLTVNTFEQNQFTQDQFIIEPGDQINILVEDYENYNYNTVVDQNGNIPYSSIAVIHASGLTPFQLEEIVGQKLSPYIKKPKVKVSVKKPEAVIKSVEEEKELVKTLEEAEKKPAESAMKEILIAPGDIINIIVRDHGEYSFKAIVQPEGHIVYPRFGKIFVSGFTIDRMSREITSRLSNQISDPRVVAAIKGKLDSFDVYQPYDYITKTGDIINISVENRDDYNETLVIQDNGMIYHSKLGWIPASGMKSEVLAQNIKSKLAIGVGGPRVDVFIKEFKKADVQIEEIPKLSIVFGYDFFNGARNRILNIEKGKEKGEKADIYETTKDATTGFVGPLDMIDSNVTMTVPPKYVLGPGDSLTLHTWSDVVEMQTETLVVDSKGEVVIPKTGKIIVVRGMKLDQFQEAVREELARVAFKNPKVIVTLDKLRSIQIFITGEAFRPGSYAISAAATLFNALYMCGGPSDIGSLRNIKLIRNGETKSIDFYRFLMQGDSSQDLDLYPGDTILIPPVGKRATIGGEVRRPAIYELMEDETLSDLISMAGGIRPSGFLQKVRIDSVERGKKRIMVDIDLSGSDAIQTDHVILDGDVVTVFPIPSEVINTVTIEGKVKMPGIYQLKDGMKVLDLINSAQGIMEEAYMERADLIRFNSDKKTTSLIPVNLSNAFSGMSDNLVLNQWDKLIVYSKWDVKWIADRVVSVYGAVSKPGSYERSDGMRISDLLIKSGGTLPEAYNIRAYIMRVGEKGEVTQGIPVNLDLANQNDLQNNIELKDGDTLLVYKNREAIWEPKREVEISGAVQNPNIFTRIDDMKISDLIQMAGGLLPEAYPYRALLLRLDERQKVSQGFYIDLKLALQDDADNNIELKDGDQLKVYTYEEAIWEPKKEVMINGAVQNPGTFERFDGMKVSDLIKRAGGVLPNAYLERADIKRFRPDYETYITVTVNLAAALSGNQTSDILMEDGDLLTIFTLREAKYKPENIVTIYGAVQRPDTYTRTFNMKLSDLIFAAGGVVDGAHRNIEIARINDKGQITIITVDLEALSKGDSSQDIPLIDEDMVSIRLKKDFMHKVYFVTVNGEVKYPGSYALNYSERLSDIIKRAGGLTDRAYPEATVVTRKVENLVYTEQKNSVDQVKMLFEELSSQEYQREVAKTKLMAGTSNAVEKASETASSESPIDLSTTLTGTVQESMEIGTVSAITEQAGSVVTGIEEITKQQKYIASPARKLTSFLPTGRIIIDLREALAKPGIKDDIILENGDVITIPPIIPAVSVTGAVMQPSSIVYVKGKGIKYYITQVGGYAKDADEKSVYVIKANGLVLEAKKADLSPGDVIVVPTKVMVSKVSDRLGQILSLVKFAVTTLALTYTIQVILK